VDNMLSDKQFADIIDGAPLVTIDLVITYQNSVLLGLRKNTPAKGYWFVPGGRIQKNEELPDAFLRITSEELGLSVPITAANFRGVFVHKYSNEVHKGRSHVDFHYIVLAYHLELEIPSLKNLPRVQHSKYKWSTIPSLIGDSQVHKNSKLFFGNQESVRKNSDNTQSNSDLINLYRGYQTSINSYANVVWQFPLALMALNIAAWGYLGKNLYIMLVITLINYIFLQPLYKLVANQRSIISVTQNIEQLLRNRLGSVEGSTVIPTFSYSWPTNIKSGRLLPFVFLLLNSMVLAVIVFLIVVKSI